MRGWTRTATTLNKTLEVRDMHATWWAFLAVRMMGMGQYILYFFVAGDLCWIDNYKIISEEEMSYVIHCTVTDELITEEIVTNKYS